MPSENPSSLQAFIEYTAKWLRKISQKKFLPLQKTRKSSLSNKNKIEQMAKLLREKIPERKRTRRKKH